MAGSYGGNGHVAFLDVFSGRISSKADINSKAVESESEIKRALIDSHELVI